MQTLVNCKPSKDDLPQLKSVLQFISVKPSVTDNITLYICEPCPVTVELEISNEINPFHHRKAKAEIWTNVRDKYSSSGRWHSVTMRKTSITQSKDKTTHIFQTSLLPFTTGKFEYTIRATIPTLYSSEYIWAGQPEQNCHITILPTTFTYAAITPSCGSIREIYNWYEELVGIFETNNKFENIQQFNIKAYNIAFIAGVALELDIDPGYCHSLALLLLKQSTWFYNYMNSRKFLYWCLGNSELVNHFIENIQNFRRDVYNPKKLKSCYGEDSDTYTTGGLIALLKVATYNNLSDLSDSFNSICIKKNQSSNRRINNYSPRSIIKVKKTKRRLSNYQNEILLELLVDIIKGCSIKVINQKFCSILINIYCNSNSSNNNSNNSEIIRIHLYKIIRNIYDKDVSDNNHFTVFPTHHLIIESIMNMFYLHSEWYYENEKLNIKNEICESFNNSKSPLHDLLKIIKNFIEMSSRYNKPNNLNMKASSTTVSIIMNKQNEEDNNSIINKQMNFNKYKKELYLNDIEYIFKGLFYLFLHININHPDYSNVIDLLIFLCIKSSFITMKFIHKLLNHWPRSNEMINTYIRILSKTLSSIPLKSNINTSKDTITYINKLINYIKTPNVIHQCEICYTSFKVFECNWIWELFLNYESVYENQLSDLMKYTKLQNEQNNNYDIKIISDNVLSLIQRYKFSPRNIIQYSCENGNNSDDWNDNFE